ncbi:MAG: TAXI family TRAP transporter solute-binding subunit [Granulosicoccus sp.]
MTKKQRVKKKPAWFRTLKESGLVYGLGAVVIAAATWFTYQFVEPAPPRSLTLATGSADGAYREFGKQLKSRLANNDVDLQIVETNGSVDNLGRLEKGAVDVAFMQSGLTNASQYPDLESLGAMYYEPVWIFTRKDLQISRLSELEGGRVAVGGVGSGSRVVAVQLLESNGLMQGEVTLVDRSGKQAIDALESGEVDATISVASVSAPMIQRLLGSDRAQLATLTRAPAYARREPWLTHLMLPEGVVDLQKNIPSSSIDLLAVNATLVTSIDLHPALRDLLLQAADSVFSRATVLSATDEFPRAIGSEFVLSPAADRYYEFGPPFLQRYLPFWVANLVDRLKLLALPLLALLLPLSRMLPPAYRWSVRKKIYRWYDEVQDLDQSSNDNGGADNLKRCLGELLRIENDVREIEVPLAYAHELYALRQHIELLMRQIDQRVADLSGR